MGWFSSDDDRQAFEQINNLNPQEHQSKFSHEAIAGAAAFMAEHEFEKYQEREGKVVNHAVAKELLAGFAGAEADKLFETKGLDFLDRERAKHEAKQRVHENMTEDRFNEYQQRGPGGYGGPQGGQQYYAGGGGGYNQGGYGGPPQGGYGGGGYGGPPPGNYGPPGGGYDQQQQQGGWGGPPPQGPYGGGGGYGGQQGYGGGPPQGYEGERHERHHHHREEY